MTTLRDPDNNVRNVTSITMRDADNVLRTLSGGMLRDPSNVARPFAGGGVGGMTVSVSQTSAYGYGNSHAPIRISTTNVTVTVTGGTAPYTYSWNAEFAVFEAVSPNSASTIFRSDEVSPADTLTDNMTCTVTDAHGQTADSPVVLATATNFGT